VIVETLLGGKPVVGANDAALDVNGFPLQLLCIRVSLRLLCRGGMLFGISNDGRESGSPRNA
jgi:hypothetical protein